MFEMYPSDDEPRGPLEIRPAAPPAGETTTQSDFLLGLVADRFRLVDPNSGAVVWEPGRGGSLPDALNRWLSPSPEIDPADPLARLVKGWQRKRRPRREAAVARREAVRAIVEQEGSLAAAARVLGISYQRVQQILATTTQGTDHAE